jgi:hypothetical protein
MPKIGCFFPRHILHFGFGRLFSQTHLVTLVLICLPAETSFIGLLSRAFTDLLTTQNKTHPHSNKLEFYGQNIAIVFTELNTVKVLTPPHPPEQKV